MKYRKFIKNAKNEKLDIPSVLEDVKMEYPYKTKTKHGNPYTRRGLITSIVSLSSIIVVAIFVVALLTTEQSKPIGRTEATGSIRKLESKEKLNELVSYENNTGLVYIQGNISIDGMIVNKNQYASGASSSVATPETSTEKNDGASSSTNVQVEGVDEADMVKFHQGKMYRVYGNEILINELNAGIIGDTRKLEYCDSEKYMAMNTNLYVYESYLIVETTIYEVEDNHFYYYGYLKSHPLVMIYDIDTLEEEYSFMGNGYTVDSRLIESDGNYLLIYNETVMMENDDVKYPIEFVNGIENTYTYRDIYYTGCISNRSYTHIVSIDLNGEYVSSDSTITLGSSYYKFIYCTKESIYFISESTKLDMDRYFLERIDTTSYATTILRYDIKNKKTTPVASLIISGRILDRTSIDEYEGVLRIASAETNDNKILTYFLNAEGEYELLGKIDEGLGEKNEIIKSARFSGNTCLVVTAKNTDPLYKIDLSDPRNPKIVGKFKEDGYNSYIQYLTGKYEGLAFALGYNTVDVDDEYVRTDGTKLDLYDITGDDPIEIDEINYDYYNIPAIYDMTALFVYDKYIGFETYGIYRLYEIALTKDGYKLKEAITYTYETTGKSEENYYMYEYTDLGGRMYYYNGYLYLGYTSSNDSQFYNWSIKETGIVSFDSEYNQISKK